MAARNGTAIFWSAAAMVLLAAWSIPARSDDGFGQREAGGVVIGKTDAIAMVKEVLDLGYDKIEVNYDFINETGHDIDDTVIFPLPEYRAVPDEFMDRYVGQPRLQAAGGRAVAVATVVHATLDGRDITTQLKAIGLSHQQIAMTPFDKALLSKRRLQVPKPIGDALQAAGLVDSGTPLWRVQIDYEWPQRFPAGRTVHIYHRYQPFIALGSGGDYMPGTPLAQALPKWYCADKDAIGHLGSLYARQWNKYTGVQGTAVGFVLKSANSWKDGIRSFTLRVHKRSPQEIVSLCFPGKHTEIDELTTAYFAGNFHPQQDLEVYFGNAQGELPNVVGKAPLQWQ